VAHDFLAAATRNVESSAAAPPYKLRPCVMKMVLGEDEGGVVARVLGGAAVSLAAGATLRAYRRYLSLIPLNPALPPRMAVDPVPLSTTWTMFASGSPERAARAAACCKALGLTLHGPICAAVVAAFARAGWKPASVGCFINKPERVAVMLVRCIVVFLRMCTD